jgi:GNAT superfamily N-acetyltransferase
LPCYAISYALTKNSENICLDEELLPLISSLIPRLATYADEGAIIELEQTVWGSAEEATHEYFQWCLKSPAGRAITYIIRGHSGSVVSMHMVIPLPALIAGRPTLAGISVNVATHPDYRRKGFANQIASAIYAKAEEMGIEFLFTLPNTMSHGLFTDKNSFSDLGKPLLLVRWIDLGIFVEQKGFPNVGKSLSFLTKSVSRLMPRKKTCVAKIQHVEDLEGLQVQELLEPTEFCFAIDGHWLNWRYREHPFRKYECAIVGELSSPQALAIYQVLQTIRRALIMEFLVAPEAPMEAVQALMDDVVEKTRAAGCSSVCTLGVPSSRKTNLLKKSGFLVFPFRTIWCPRIVVNSPRCLRSQFSLSSMDFSFGGLINME